MRRHTRIVVVAVLFFSMLTVITARASLDPKLNTPYQLHIVLDFADQRQLTPMFKKQTTAQLRVLLERRYGKLARVRISDDHPRLKNVRDKGLQRTLDRWDRLYEEKTHFVLVDFVAGSYHLRARQHDGATGRSSPVVRQAVVRDRQQVARSAAKLIDRDFALTGTVTGGNDKFTKVGLQGGGLGVPLKRWLKPGDVFAVCRIRKAGTVQAAERIRWGVLRVVKMPVDGICLCEYFHRYEEETLSAAPGVAGYRCLQLATIRAPLTLQVVHEKTNRPLENVQVHVGAKSFAETPLQRTTRRRGMFRSPNPFSGVAFVKIVIGKPVATFPVALVNRKTIICRINPDPKALSHSYLLSRFYRWERRIYEGLHFAGERVKTLNSKLNDSQATTLVHARRGLNTLEVELSRLDREKSDLNTAARKAELNLDFSEGDKRLEELHKRKRELSGFIVRLRKFIKESGSKQTKKLQALVAQAGLLEQQGKYDLAIAAYRKILEQSEGQLTIRKHLRALQSDWYKERGAEHKAARTFLHKTWPAKMTVLQIKKNLPQAQKALLLCRQLGDRLTPRRMLQANIAHAVFLKKRLAALRAKQINADSRAELKEIAQLASRLGQLHSESLAWVQGKN